MKRMLIGLAVMSAMCGLSPGSAIPPATINYQGVLLDNVGGGPENGDRDMIFHFYDADVGGNEIARDNHLLADGKQVSVMMGLFNVLLGDGVVEDGDGVFPDEPYDSLDKVFRDFQAVYLEVEARVGPAGGGGAFETLSPRTRVVSAPYALNAQVANVASSLEGLVPGDFIDTSATPQTKAGNLTVADLTVAGDDLLFANGAHANALGGNLFLSGGSADTSELFLRGGNSYDDGEIIIQGQGPIHFASGNGEYRFLAANGGERATLDDSNLSVSADLTVRGNNIRFDPSGFSGPNMFGNQFQLTITAGLEDTDDIFMQAGNSIDDGRLAINGDGPIELRAGNGLFSFVNGNTTLETAALDPQGNLQVDGGLTAAAGSAFPNASIAITGIMGISGETRIRHAAAGSLGQANGTLLAPTSGLVSPGTNGLIIETSVLGESAGIFLNGDSIALWSPGDQGRLLSVYDEDLLTAGDPHSVVAAERFSIDGGGNVAMDGDLTVAGNTIQGAPGAFELFVQAANSVVTHLDFDNDSAGVVARWCTNGNCIGANQLMRVDDLGGLSIGGTLSQNQFDLAEAYLKSEPLEPGDLVRLDPDRRGAVLLSAGPGDSTVLGVVSERPGVVLGGAPFGVDRLERMWGPDVKARFMQQREQLIAAELSRDPETRTRMESVREAATVALAAPEANDGPQEKSDLESLRANQERELTDLTAMLETKALETFYWQQAVPVALAGRVPVKVDAQYGAIAAGDALSPSPIPGVAMKDDGQGPVIGIALESFSGGRGKVEAFIVRGQGPSPQAVAQTRELAEQVERRTPDPVTGIQSMPGHLQIVLDQDGDDEARLSVFRDGQEDERGAEVFRVDESGNVFAKGSFRPNAMDVAELFALSEPAEPGDVLAADPDNPGRFRLAREALDAAVIGVVATQPGMLLGGGVDRILAVDAALAGQLEEARTAKDRQAEGRIWRELEARFSASHAAVAMTGTVMVKVDAGYGAVRTGDLLTSSPTPGHAMRSDDHLPGTILGKALEPLDSGTGVIKMLVMLR